MNKPSQLHSHSICSTIVWTVIYALLFFPLLFLFVVLAFVIFESNPSWASVGIILIDFCIPLSLPISIYLMWSNYKGRRYAPIAWSLPFIITITLLTLEYLIDSALKFFSSHDVSSAFFKCFAVQ